MKNHSYLISAIIAIVLFAMAFNYYRVIVKKDYILTDFVACDPLKEDCFFNTCPVCDEIPQYFKMIQKKAASVKGCDKPGHNCLPFSCPRDGRTCRVVYCNEKNNAIGYPCEGEE